MQRREFLKLAGLAASACATPFVACSKTRERPNFIIIVGDDVGWNDLTAYGHPHIKTPYTQEMADNGLRFTNAFLTTSSCSPSRASIMTGRYPHNTGAPELHQPLPGEQVVFPGLLKESGYYTASVGKWHLGEAAQVHFDRIEGGAPSGCEHWIDVLRDRPKDRPFFMWFAAKDAHRPYEPNAIPKPHRLEDVEVPPFLPDNEETRRDLALYYDEVARLDEYVGHVLEELDHQGIEQNTFVLYLSDNGRPFPRCKTRLYDSGIKTPFIAYWPGRIEPGGVCNNLVSAVDIAPTILELAGLEVPDTFQGLSFAGMLKDPSFKTRDFIFGEHNWHDYQAFERAVRSSRYLYIRNAFPHLNASPPADAVRSPTYRKMIELYRAGELDRDYLDCFIRPRPAEELYDCAKDPFQMNNVIQDPSYQEVLASLRTTLDLWSDETGDEVPTHPTPDKFDRWSGMKL